MKTILPKKIYITSVFIIIFHCAYSQILKNNNLNLNSGGAIYDVAYDSYLDAFIVVGDFNSVNGVLQNNIAFVSATTFDLLPITKQPYIDVDGLIRTVEVHKKESTTTCNPLCFVSQGHYSVFIGGDFSNVYVNNTGTQERINLARLSFSFFDSAGINKKYGLSSWDAEISSGYGWVNDLKINEDTLIVGGVFTIDNPTYNNSYSISNIASFSVSSNSVSPNVNHFNSISTQLTNMEVLHIENKNASSYYVNLMSSNIGYGIDAHLFEIDAYIGFKTPFPSSYLGPPQNSGGDHFVNYTYFKSSLDTLTFLSKRHPYSSYWNVYNEDRSIKNLVFHPDLYFPNLSNIYMAAYQNRVYLCEDDNNFLKTYNYLGDSMLRVKYQMLNGTLNLSLIDPSIPSDPLDNFTPWYSDISQYASVWEPAKIYRRQDKLFLSGNLLTKVGQHERIGLAVFCLEPINAKPFIQADTTICQGNIRTYTIPKAKYANGYKWTYTGDGAKVVNIGQSVADDTLISGVPIYFNDIEANSIVIEFLQGTTAGTLTVEPYTICNTSSDYQFSKGQAIDLTLAPLPNLSMVADTLAFNCINNDSLNLEMIVVATDHTYSWFKAGSPELSTDSLFTIYNSTSGSNSSVSAPTLFYGTVKEAINGCTNTDSIFVEYDMVPPNISQTDITANPSVFNCSTTQMDFDINLPNVIVEWGLTDSTVFTNGTFTVYSKDTLNFYAHITNVSNGCKAVQQYQIEVDETQLTGEILNYPNFSQGILDTINCNQTLLNLTIDFSVSDSATINDSISWIYNGTYIGNTLTLTETDSSTSVYQYITYNDESKCTKSVDVIVYFDFEKPFVSHFSTPPTLNCSTDSLQLMHPNPYNQNETTGWLDTMNINSYSDSLTVYNPGTYLYESILNRSGCATIDTVQIIQSNELLLSSTNDTTICIGDLVNLNASPINYSNSVDYTWSNGDNTQATSATGGIDDTLYVTAISSDGCVGLDTVVVSTNDPITASFNTFAGCIDGSASIAVDTIFGGAGSYAYSLDGQNFVSNGTFTQLSFGNYPVLVKDGMGCTKSFNVEVDNNAQAPSLNFLVPTYNEVGDTIVAVNISDFNGFDSLYWDYPGNTNIIEINDTMLVFSFNTEDWFDVGIVAYQDTCSFRFDKSIYFGPYKPSFDSTDDTLGITNLVIYPNPTNGQFTVEVMFGVVQSYSIIVTNSNGQLIPQMTINGQGDEVIENFTFPIGSATGAYHINIISEHDARNKIIILQ